MQYVVTAEQMRALDRATIDDIGIPGAVLMETAGRAVAAAAAELLGGARGRVAVVCGAGNNGGDGYVAARVLRERGVAATVYLAAARERIAGDALTHLNALEQCGGRVAPLWDAAALDEHAEAVRGAGVVVDAVFGTGLVREVTGHYAAVIELINEARGRVLAVDLPSGLAADTGAVLGVAARADRTVTFAFAKPALVSAPGFARCGEVTVAEIGIPRDLARAEAVRLAVLEPDDVRAWLPAHGALAHKGRRGHALIVGGSPGKRGAARMAALAALRAGAGLATIACAGDPGAADAVMSAELDADRAGADAVLAELARGKQAVAMGPGMPTSEGGAALVRAALTRVGAPLVLDADALNHLVGALDAVAAATVPVVLTPHPGEAGRLLGSSTADVERDRIAAVRALAAQSRAVVVLKGARTVVCDGRTGDEFVTINPTGGPALATAGTGDVLTGVIAALLAQGVAPAEAARLAVWLHGAAAQSLPSPGTIATDVITQLPAAIAALLC